MTSKRRIKLVSLEEALDVIKDGMTLALGGFLTSHRPMAAVREIVRRGIKNLTVASPPGSLDIDLLIGAGCVREVLCPYVGAEGLCPIAPFFRRAAEQGEITVKECEGGMLVAMLEAAERDLPFMPWRGGVGTSIPELNPDVKPFHDPIKGELLLAVPALEPDVALLHAAKADPYGNVQTAGDTFADVLIARAARHVIVQVEEVISNEELRLHPEQTILSHTEVDAVVHAPYGAHPFSCDGYYRLDREAIERYVTAAQKHLSGEDPQAWGRYLGEWVLGPKSHEAYLERVGLEKLFSLAEGRPS